MTKKHLITCSVILVVLLISTFDLCDARTVKGAKTTSTASAFIFKKAAVTGNDYNFADEDIPANDAKVTRKISYSIWMHSFSKVQSNILHKKAVKLFPIIEPILKIYGIPEDFKYIPLVESGLCEGTSARGARGLWQFMPGTARNYGLRVNGKNDERLNVRKSTIAACKYIRELYAQFDSWTLAAAAYNNGSNKLERAMNKQNEDNYFKMHLNRETGSYIYKLIAMKEVIENPGKHGYKQYYAATLPQAPLLVYY